MSHPSRQPEVQHWQRWPTHPTHPTWQAMPSPYPIHQAYSVAPMTTMPAPQYPVHHGFVYDSYASGAVSAPMGSSKQYMPERPMLQIPYGSSHEVPAPVEENTYSPIKQMQSPVIKTEPQYYDSTKDLKSIVANPVEPRPQEPAFTTSIDRLLKVMQQKADPSEGTQTAVAPAPTTTGPETSTRATTSRAKARVGEDDETDQKDRPYVCRRKKCRKRFSQTTHLRIHERSHTGERPHKCSFAGCGGSFTQKGNLRTHERRHLGERPFKCKVPGCTRAFPQKGNLKAHEDTHFRRNTFRCIFKSCGKTFSSRGNLKTHQNNYHKEEIRELELKFSTMSSVKEMTEADRELWDYFSTVHKNSNKGIKGRGKKCRVELVSQPGSLPGQTPLQAPAEIQHAPYAMSNQGMSHPVEFHHFGMQRNTFGHELMVARAQHGYEMYDMGDQASISEGTMTPASSPGGMYEDHHRNLPFQERIY
ncbi:hypothetical protein GGS20DRAFT_521661 [Poronia punctata]|nr:hypothetical protein GGS20DRAFT_521661 [Poronia punctata]